MALSENMTTILVVGATGKQGGRAISTLLDQNEPNLRLRFLTRNPSSAAAQKLQGRGAQPVKADLFDRSALDQALKGVDRAFLVTDAGVGEAREAEQGRVFVEAAANAGVKHLVFSSVSAAGDAKAVPHFRSKFAVENCLKVSGMTYTILRPVAFMDNFPSKPGFGRFLVVGLFYASIGWKKCQLVATEDIGAFAAKALLSPNDATFRNATIDLSGGNYDLSDVRRAFQRAQGGSSPWFASYLPVAVRRMLPNDFKQMMIYLQKNGYPDVDTTALKKVHPGLMTMEEWVKRQSSVSTS